KPSAIWLRAEFPVQTTRTRFLISFRSPFAVKRQPLVAAARATARRGGRLRGPDEAAHEGALDFPGQRVDVESFPRKKRPRIFAAVDTSRFDVDVIEAGFCELRDVLVVAQSPGHAPDPQLHV